MKYQYILFVGDKPSEKMKSGALPFQGAHCEKRLNEWINYIVSLRLNDWLNYIVSLPIAGVDIVNQWGNFETQEELYQFCRKYLKVIALGNNASKALTKAGVEHFKMYHPSGLNRKLNNKKDVQKKLKECYEYIRK